MTSPTFIWSDSRASNNLVDPLTNSQNDYTLPAATLDPSRMLVLMVNAVDTVTTGTATTFSAVYSTDPTFATSTAFTGISQPFGSSSPFAPDNPLDVFGWIAWLPLPDFASGYVRVTSSAPLNQVQTLFLIGNVDTPVGSHVSAGFFNFFPGFTAGTDSFVIGWPGTAADSLLSAPSDAIILQSGWTTDPRTLTVSPTWGQTSVTNTLSAGSVYATEARQAASWSFANGGSNAGPFFGSYYTGAQWTINADPYRSVVVGLWLNNANLPPLTRRGRAWAFIAG